jgi:lipopolysaccharide biosynthesis regulator YciM
MRKIGLITFLVSQAIVNVYAQDNAVVREYTKVFTTYPFSDPNPIPVSTNVYPYFRYDGFTDKPVQKEWKVVELENQYIKLMILPQVGGKIWSAIEKSTGKSFVYDNHVVKFRDIAMRGPWTSGGIEANYGIIGHTPNCATPVNYITRKNDDGSVSCIIGVLDLLTRTNWTMEINLPKDKAYFTTKSFWYNGTTIEQPYYHWMNTGIKTNGNLQYMYPGNHYLGHEGEYGDWPVNKQNGKDVSFYNNNNFGGYKSYHVFGKYTDFFGAYWHDDDFGMARYSGQDEKAGKKIWIWGLSQQGMIWEKLLTDTDGQYSEIQSGRLFNQTADKSTFTPFKHRSFSPDAADTWTEYWYPVLKTKGFVEANESGALNVKYENGWLKIYFNPTQKIADTLKVIQGLKTIYHKKIELSPLKTFVDSVKMDGSGDDLFVMLGDHKLIYRSNPDANNLSRPLDSPKDFDWSSAYGLYAQGRELMDEKMYPAAEEKLQAALQKDPNYLPALVQMAELMYRDMRYAEALELAKKALSIDTNDGGANYYYALINAQLGNIVDAKDGFDIASLSGEYKSAAYNGLGKLYLQEKNWNKALTFAAKAIDFNRFDLTALEIEAIAYRNQNNADKAKQVLDTILSFDPLNHFDRFEKYLWQPSEENKTKFASVIVDEMPVETYLELAIDYYKNGCVEESAKVLQLAPANALVNYWLAFLQHKAGQSFSEMLTKANNASPAFVFPFRSEDEEVLLWAKQQNSNWKPVYYLALLYKDRNRIEESKKLFIGCGNEPDFAPFYAARATMQMGASDLADLKKAVDLDKDGWRYPKLLTEYYINHNQYPIALATVEPFYHAHPENYIIGMLYAKSLLLNKQYKSCSQLLSKINILPFEGATIGRELYHEAELMQAIEKMQAKKYANALIFINDAKKWPLNLGVGKPYPENLDERLEDWMSYKCYLQLSKKNEAQQALQKIIKFNLKVENTVSNFIPANHLVTAWAMEALDGKAKATEWLNAQVKQYPGNKILAWCKQVFENEEGGNIPDDSGVRLLEQLMLVK